MHDDACMARAATSPHLYLIVILASRLRSMSISYMD